MGYVLAFLISAVAANQPLNTFNDQFAMDVDSGDSCWDRVGGEVGSYGKPSDFGMDALCNYRLKSKDVPSTSRKWYLERL